MGVNRIVMGIVIINDNALSASTSLILHKLLNDAETNLLPIQLSLERIDERSKDTLRLAVENLNAAPLVVFDPKPRGYLGRKPNPHPLPPVPKRLRRKT
jgi:hypothetical protein